MRVVCGVGQGCGRVERLSAVMYCPIVVVVDW